MPEDDGPLAVPVHVLSDPRAVREDAVPTNVAKSSVAPVRVSETCEGPLTVPLSSGAVGGVVSRGVVTVTVLLRPDRLRALSVAVT